MKNTKYTRKQILESIKYWKKQLNENKEDYDDDIEMSKISHTANKKITSDQIKNLEKKIAAKNRELNEKDLQFLITVICNIMLNSKEDNKVFKKLVDDAFSRLLNYKDGTAQLINNYWGTSIDKIRNYLQLLYKCGLSRHLLQSQFLNYPWDKEDFKNDDIY